MPDKPRAPRNRTLTLTEAEQTLYDSRLLRLTGPVDLDTVCNRTLIGDALTVLDWLPAQSVDLVFADPPYNLTKAFHGGTFTEMSLDAYRDWLESWLLKLPRLLKPTAAVYLCGDWRSSTAIHTAAAQIFKVQNRITWEREKGRSARRNWKNASEDIWFCTVSDAYVFNRDAVRLKRQVRAPYTNAKGQPKDWTTSDRGRFRLTAASNLWTDLTVPFWSMPENTDHPTQKPEKLLAKVLLASTNPGDMVLDPFLGSGTTSVVASKLGRRYMGIELDAFYGCLAEKRLALATQEPRIQGYEDGVFWERNTSRRKR